MSKKNKSTGKKLTNNTEPVQVSRYDIMGRKHIFLLFSMIQFFFSVILLLLPHFSKVQEYTHIMNTFDIQTGWAKIYSAVLFSSSFSFFLIYYFKFDMMYKSLIFSRLPSLIGIIFCFMYFNVQVFIAIPICVVEVSFFLIAHFSIRNDEVPPPVMKSDIMMPSMIFNLLFTIWLCGIVFGTIVVPNTLTKLLGWHELYSTFWCRLVGFEIFGILILWLNAIRKNCTIFVLGYALFGSVIEVACLSILIIFRLIHGTLQLCSVIFVLIAITFLALLSIKEEKFDPKTIDSKKDVTKKN